MKNLFKALLILSFLGQIFLSNVFTVIGPLAVRLGESYRCVATNHVSGSAIRLNISLQATFSNNNEEIELYEIISVNPHSTKTVNFGTANFPPADYKLSVTGLNSFQFSGEKKLSFVVKQFSIFVQTNKAIYKANDLIQFRLFAVNSQTLPYSVNGPTIITITDPSNNKIKEFSNVTFVKGKYENELLLSSAPKLGSWTISVEAEGQAFSKSVEVQEYTLPAFFATISAPKNVPYSAGKFPVTVGAQYTFGQKVEGTAVVSFMVNGYLLVYEKQIEINSSSVTFDVDIKNDLEVSQPFYDQFVDVSVEFTDKLTAQLAAAKTKVNIMQYNYQIFFKGASSFKPGLLYVFKLTVKKFDGSPADENSPISVQTGFDDNQPLIETFTLDVTGSVDLQTGVAMNATSLEIIAKFEDAQLQTNVFVASSHQNEYLSIDVQTIEPTLYTDVEVDILTTENVPYVIIVFISKGLILETRKLQLENGFGSFKFYPKFSHAPITNIIAYYVKSNDDIVSDSVSVSLRDRLPNFVNLAVSPTTCKPGENVSVSITSTIFSTVSLLAIDQRVLLLKTGNDLSNNEVFDSLNMYNSFWNNEEIFIDFRPHFRPFWFETYEMRFESVNLVIISNAIDDIPFNRLPDYEYDIQAAVHPTTAPINKDTNEPTVRKDFSETFLWQSVDILKIDRRQSNSVRGREVISVKVPESITSYIISGVTMNNRFGMGLPLTFPSVTVFLPFFIQFTLPFSIKRGEKLKQNILVFNFLSSDQTVTVSIKKNEAEFQLIDYELSGWQSDDQRYFQTFVSSAGSTKKLSIRLVAKVLGFVTLKITAIGSLAGDAIEQKLRVVPEGVPRFITNSTIIIKSENSAVSKQLSCSLPPSAISDTVSISANVVGDILGASLNNLDKLIQMPYGCGEQNMLNFVPNIVILRYLELTNKSTPAIRSKAISFTELGYQRELEYLRSDGSFSAFGNSDPSGSTWLSAFVVKSFVMAYSFDYISIDTDMLERALHFITLQQNANGSFKEVGRVIHKDMQGGSSSDISLTAYVSIVLTQCLPLFPKFKPQRDSALNYLISNYNDTDVYSLAILSYALSLAEHPSFATILDKLNNLAIATAEDLHWQKVKEVDPDNYWSSEPMALDVEVTSYVLLAIAGSDISKALQIVRWLVKQQNANGGFQSTQDTVVGLEALGKLAALLISPTSSISLTLSPNVGNQIVVSMNSTNALVLRSFDLAQSVRQLNVLAPANGKGLAVVSLACNFYEVEASQTPRFLIQHRFEDPCLGYLTSSVCLSYIPVNDDVISNMVLVRIHLPSGFVYDPRKISNKFISKIETTKSGTEVDIYINNLTEDTVCFYINAIQTFILDELKDGTIEVVDYYDNSKKALATFTVPPLLECQPKIIISNSESSIEPIEPEYIIP